MLTQQRLKELFNYDPETGWFTNRTSRGAAAEGKRAGTFVNFMYGYRRIVIAYKKYYEHHLAWLYVHGEWVDEIDHRDGDGSNNAIANLRACDRSQNNFNSLRRPGQSGLRGAYLDRRNLQWYSQIQLGGQVTFLGNFDSAEEAHEAFMAAAEIHHGEFAYHNRKG
jgi:hypothetical protein